MAEDSKPQTAMELALKAGDDAYLFATNEATALHDAFRAVISTYLAAAPVNASMGEAKPLVWEQSGPFSKASAVGVEFEILDSTPAWERPFQLLIRWGFSKETVKFFRTLKEAQDFAQADIGERISSASQATPRQSELVAALRDALAPFARAAEHVDRDDLKRDPEMTLFSSSARYKVKGKHLIAAVKALALAQPSGVAASLPTAGVPEGWRLVPEDAVTHLGDFNEACTIAWRVSVERGDTDNASYWQRQVNTIKAIRSALTPIEGV